MQGQSTNTLLDLNTHPTGPFWNTNETGTAEAKLCTYFGLSPCNENQGVSRLTEGENVESQHYDESIGLYNQMYTDALLSRQLLR